MKLPNLPNLPKLPKPLIVLAGIIAVLMALKYLGLTTTEGFRSTKCFSCEAQMPEVAHGTKCFSCERQMPQVAHGTKCLSCEQPVKPWSK